jgi:hypothetical protein
MPGESVRQLQSIQMGLLALATMILNYPWAKLKLPPQTAIPVNMHVWYCLFDGLHRHRTMLPPGLHRRLDHYTDYC